MILFNNKLRQYNRQYRKMLTPQLCSHAQKMLRQLCEELEFDNRIKQTVKSNVKSLNEIINSYKDDPKIQRRIYVEISNQIGPRILQLQKVTQKLQNTEQQLRYKQEKINKQKIMIGQQRQQIQLSIQEIKQTIAKIQYTGTQSMKRQIERRRIVSGQLEKSLNDFQDKIVLSEKESLDLKRENEIFRVKRKEIQQKLGRLEVDFRKKAEEEDSKVKKQKEELMMKLQSLESKVSEVTELNKEYSTKEKNNFDKKLSLYLKTKKFSEYTTSFENSAKTIDQCKEQLMKGMQRLNDAQDTQERYERDTKELCIVYTNDFKKREEKEARIESLKKQKQVVRERIISLQNRIKEQKIRVSDNE